MSVETELKEKATPEPAVEPTPPPPEPSPPEPRRPWYIRERKVKEEARPRDRGYLKPCPSCEEITRFIPGTRENGIYTETCSVCDHTFRWLIVHKRDPEIGFAIGVSEGFDLLDYYAAILGADYISSRVEVLVLRDLLRLGKRPGKANREAFAALKKRLAVLLDS